MKKLLLFLLLSALTATFVLYWRGPEIVNEVVAVVQDPHAELKKAFQEARQNPLLSGAAIGFCLLDDQGKVVFEDTARTAFIPASTLKTLTTATALEQWGPEFRIETELRSTVVMKEGVIDGDLIIRGGADPMLSLEDLEAWVRDLYGKGLRRISGRIIGDGRLLTGSIYGDFWDWGDIGNGYGSGVSGLNLEHNRFIARFRPSPMEGSKATFLGASPEVPGMNWINEVMTGPADSGDGVVIHGGERTQVMHFRGTVPMTGRDFQVVGAVPDPELYAAHHLRALLINAGITVDGNALSATQLTGEGTTVPEAGQALHTHRSPPLLEIVRSIHESSDNHETECLYRLLGLKEKMPPDQVVREHWKTRGLVFESLRMEDGCGLARADFIRPLDLAMLQYIAGAGPQGAVYRESLLATEDGSLRWKGGAMSGVRSYTGFLKAPSGTEFSFALMVNHFSDGQAVSELRDRVLAAVRGL